MTISHHPTDETLAEFAAGTLDEGKSLVVSVHLTHCQACRQAVKQFNLIAGAMLETQSVLAGATSADHKVRMPNLDTLPPMDAAPDRSHHLAERRFKDDGKTSPLDLYSACEWRRIGLGVQFKSVDVPSNDGTRVFLLKAAPGTRLPDHRHSGLEWTCVLKGAFSHDFGRFGPGDFDEADHTVEHRPFVEREGDCICLVALNGQIELRSWVGRLIQPLVKL